MKTRVPTFVFMDLYVADSHKPKLTSLWEWLTHT